MARASLHFVRGWRLTGSGEDQPPPALAAPGQALAGFRDAIPLALEPTTRAQNHPAPGQPVPGHLYHRRCPPDRGRYFRAILMTLISDGARSMIFEPENSALARSQGPEEPVLYSCKFQWFVAKFSRYLPLSGAAPGVCEPSLGFGASTCSSALRSFGLNISPCLDRPSIADPPVSGYLRRPSPGYPGPTPPVPARSGAPQYGRHPPATGSA